MSTLIFLIVTIFTSNIYAQELEKKDEFKPSGKLWGYAFGDMYYKMSGKTSDTLSKIPWGDGEFSQKSKSAFAFTFRRIYLGYDYNIAPNFSTLILLEGNDNVLTPGGDRSFLIKAMNLKWKNFLGCSRTDFIIGQSSTPTWSMSEKIWGYRPVEKNAVDARKMGSATDLGLTLDGRIDSAGNYGYLVMFGNGVGPKPEGNFLKKVYFQVYAKLLDQKLILEANTEMEAQESNKNRDHNKAIQYFEGFVSYNTSDYTLGITYAQQMKKNYKVYQNDITIKSDNDTLDIKPTIISFFVRGTILKDKLFAFARYDMIDPDMDFNKTKDKAIEVNFTQNFMTFGVDWAPQKNVHFIPNLWMNSYTWRGEDKNKRDMELVPRLTFYYVFK